MWRGFLVAHRRRSYHTIAAQTATERQPDGNRTNQWTV